MDSGLQDMEMASVEYSNIFRDFIMLTRNFDFVVVTKVPRQLLVYAHKLVKVPINIYVKLK